VKSTVWKIPFGGEDSWSETITAWAGAGHLAARWDAVLALDHDDGPRRSWPGRAIRKKRRGSLGQLGCARWELLGHEADTLGPLLGSA
jgi:hypothetical protein